jgi:hypothetical protein
MRVPFPSSRDYPHRAEAIVFRGKATALQLRRSLHNHWQHPVKRRTPQLQNTKSDNTQVLAESITPLWSSHDRQEWNLMTGKIENLRVAIRQINGIELPAQAIFSFWAQVGKPSQRNGYVEGRELRQGCIIPSIGGGLCQLSNALYSAALDANLEILERHAHSQVIPGSLAEIGRDATVFWNYIDLRFRSNTPLYIEAFLTADALVVRFMGHPQINETAAAPTEQRPLIKHSNSCQTCGVTSCFRNRQTPVDILRPQTTTAYLLDEYWPEFNQYIQDKRQSGDGLLVPLDGQRWHKSNYAWDLAGFDTVKQAIPTTLERALACRRISPQGQSRQQLLLKYDRQLAQHYAKQLQPAVTHLVVMQNLLPFLWESGQLGGRTFDVLMTRLPMDTLQTRLDQVAQRYPESPTLADFRGDRALVEAERQALQAAHRIITPHREIASLFAEKAVLLDWCLPAVSSLVVSSIPTGQTILFPASTLGRKGAYELRQVAQDLNLNLRILGREFEGAEFWQDITIVPATPNPFSDVGIVVLPAHVENRPRLLLKASASGIPVIASEACGLQGVAGVTTIPNGDGAALKAAIVKQFQIQKTTPDTRPGVNSEAHSASPLKRTEPEKVVHSTRFNGFSL